jgi:hypothetical protein
MSEKPPESIAFEAFAEKLTPGCDLSPQHANLRTIKNHE